MNSDSEGNLLDEDENVINNYMWTQKQQFWR